MLLGHMQRRSRSCARCLEYVTLGKRAFHGPMMTSLAEPEFQLILVSEPIAMLPDPRVILFDAASRLVSFQTPPVYLLRTRYLWLFKASNARPAVAVNDFGGL
jgi:hypothetical protein